MVYESDFYTTRRPYRSIPSISTYSVSTPRYYTVRDAPDTARRAAEEQYSYSYQSSTESRSGDPYTRPVNRSYTSTERTTAPSRQVRILPGLGKVHVVHTYDRIVPYVGHKRLTVVTSNPLVYKVRPSILNKEFDRIEHKYRPITYISALSEYLNSRPAVRYVRYPYTYSYTPSYYYTIYRPYYSTYYTNRYLIRRPYYYDSYYYPYYNYYYDYYPLYRPRYSSLYELRNYLSTLYPYYSRYYNYYPFYNPRYWSLYSNIVYTRNPDTGVNYFTVARPPIPYVEPPSPRFARTFDDETRLIRAETASLLKRIHSPIPRTPRAFPLPYISRYDEYPSKVVSDNYIYRMLMSSPRNPRVVSYTTYYTEPVRKYFGQGQLACISFAGDKVHPRRRNVYVYEDPVRNDIQLLSYYISKFRQERPAVSIKELPSAKILSPARPTRIFTSSKAAEAKKKETVSEVFRPIRSPADGEAIKRAQNRREEETRLAAEKAQGEEAARREVEAKKLEAARLAEIARQEELAAKAAAEKAAELERQAELARQEELAKQAEIERARRAEEERARLEEEKRLEELAKAEEERQQLLRLEEIARQAEEEREAELARQAEELAELARQEAELAELTKQKEEEEARRKKEEDEAELARQEEELAELERQERELAELAKQEVEIAEKAQLEAEQARKEAAEAEEAAAEASLDVAEEEVASAEEVQETTVAEEERPQEDATEQETTAEEEPGVEDPHSEEVAIAEGSIVSDDPSAQAVEELEPEPVVEEPETPEGEPTATVEDKE